MNFSVARLKEAMALAGLSQSELAKKSGTPKSSLNHYLSGNYDPKIDNVRKLAIALNVNEYYLMGLIDDPAIMPVTQDQLIEWDEKYNKEGDLACRVKFFEQIQLVYGKQAVELLEAFVTLNHEGQVKVIDYTNDLTKVIQYKNEGKA